MNKSSKIIDKFVKSREDIEEVISVFPKTLREEILFGSWSFKDILGHLNAWANHQIQVIESLKLGKTAEKPGNTTKFNEVSFKKRHNLTFEEVYEEFLDTNKRFVNAYENLPDHFLDEKIWHDKNHTLRTYAQIEIDHFREEHKKEILRILNTD